MDYFAHEIAYRGDSTIIDNRASKKIRIFGVGALGSWLADLLCRQGYKISVIDKDKVEHANFGTQNYGRTDVGRSKAIQCANNIMRRIGVSVESISKEVKESNVHSLVKEQDLVIDVFDNVKSRELICAACKEHNVDAIHSGMGDGYFEIAWNKDYKAVAPKDEDETACDYPLASNLVWLCVSWTAEVVNRFIDRNEKIEVAFWLKNMKALMKEV